MELREACLEDNLFDIEWDIPTLLVPKTILFARLKAAGRVLVFTLGATIGSTLPSPYYLYYAAVALINKIKPGIHLPPSNIRR